MPEDALLGRLNDVFRLVFEDKALSLSAQTTSDDIPAWDSMSNITLAIELEHCFGIKIKTAEMEAFRSVGDVIALLRSHMSQPA